MNTHLSTNVASLFKWRRNVNVKAHGDISDNSVLPTLQQFSGGPLLFHHDGNPVHKARSRKKWFSQFGVQDLDWPA